MMIKYKAEKNIGILSLNRPEKRNALHPDLVKQMKEKLDEIEHDENIKVLIITGEGKAFCAGADLSYLDKLRKYSAIENQKDSRELAELFLMVYNFPKPVIAAVNGAAIAGGCGLASVCDLIVANEEYSKFGYSEVKIGFIPAMVSIFLIRKVGEGFANQLFLSADVINGKRAYEMGFVNYLYNNVLDGAMEVASNLVSNSEYSLNLTKKMIKTVSRLSAEDAVEYCVGLNTISRSSKDFKDGLEKFLNKK
ncbi:MAG: enoyl-CoA hydratase/isomerase family protein [Ignavibacteriae bacterium]|nr:MAG: enoyl-CoA hydratase/isomerase family protein [Ignavibacteriota bacterium]